MRRFIWLLMITLFMSNFFSFQSFAVPHDLAPGAQAATLMDAQTGKILYQKNAQKRLPIASITKIMTAILALENAKLTDIVTVSKRAQGVEGSSLYLKTGDKIPLENLLYGLMLRSGNDAAVAIAEHIGGSLEGFVFIMNRKVAELGLSNTHFTNPHGLHDPKHYSSAEDMAKITSYALKNSDFKKIVKTQKISLPWPGEQNPRLLLNKNKLLTKYKDADGVKTGFTKAAGRTLVGSATKNGNQLVTVTLNDGNDWNDHINMFEYGFKQYSFALAKGAKLNLASLKLTEGTQLVSGSNFIYAVKPEEKGYVVVEPLITRPLTLSGKDSVTVGSLRIYLKDSSIGTIPLVLQKSEYPWYTSLFNRFEVCIDYLRALIK